MDQGLVYCKCGGLPILSWVTPNLVRMYCGVCKSSTEAVPEPAVYGEWYELNAPFLPFTFEVSARSK